MCHGGTFEWGRMATRFCGDILFSDSTDDSANNSDNKT
jgi:hypothetical protein